MTSSTKQLLIRGSRHWFLQLTQPFMDTGPFGFSYDVSKTSLNFGVSMFPGILSGNESWSTSMTSFCFSWELESALLDRILDHITKNNPILSIMSPGLVPFALLFLFDLFFG
uniref:Uncharacterized protein n=1 Tax=Rhizophora mucronata TaxID=61149 RepID=A0A2P2MMR1_RHIMU